MPGSLSAAGVALFPRMMLSFSFLFFPLAVPGLLFLAQAPLVASGGRRSPWQPVAAAVSFASLLAAPLCLLVHQDPISWSNETGSGYASDTITATESLLAFLCILAAVVAGLAAPPDRAPSA